MNNAKAKIIVQLPEIQIDGRFIKIAKIKKEFFEEVLDPGQFIDQLKDDRADIFTFLQNFPDTIPKFDYYMEWDNVAAIPIKGYNFWRDKQITKQTNAHIRKAEQKGIFVRIVDFNDDLIRGIMSIYNESPIRQGKPFIHYGKDFQYIQEDMAQDLDRCEFLGAYYKQDLIGFIKLIYGPMWARSVNIISKIEHRDKSPNNALIVKAVQLCDERKIPYLVYGKYDYGTGQSGLTDFKRSNGFVKIDIPRYFIPLTAKGDIALQLNLHHGIFDLLPDVLKRNLLDIRRKWYSRIAKNKVNRSAEDTHANRQQ